MVTQNLLYRSERASFSCTSIALCNKTEAFQLIGITGKGWGQPTVGSPPHPFHEDSTIAAALQQDLRPVLADLKPKHGQCPAVHGHSVVPKVSASHPAQPCAPVNASKPLLQTTWHDSGAVWSASSPPFNSFIHYTPPIYPGAQRSKPCKQNFCLLH